MQEEDCGETNSQYQSGNDSTKCHMLHLGRISEKFEDKSEVYHCCFLLPILILPVIVDFLDTALQEYVKELNAQCHLSLNTSTLLMTHSLSHQIAMSP